MVDGVEEWPVEAIIDEKQCGRGYRYLVCFVNQPPSEDRWLAGSLLQENEALDRWLRGVVGWPDTVVVHFSFRNFFPFLLSFLTTSFVRP